MELSIVVVNYRSDRLVKRLQAGLTLRKNWEWVVVDNSKTNRGFSKGCNTGATRAKGVYLLFLNPDTSVTREAIDAMLVKLKSEPKIGVLGPQLVDVLGKAYLSFTRQPTCVTAAIVYSGIDAIWPNNAVSKAFWYRGQSLSIEREVGSVSGAAMLVRKNDFEGIGGFDEGYFMYWEDADFCRRLHRSGKRVVFFPIAQVEHARAGTTPKKSQEVKRWFRKSRHRYFRKHFGFWCGNLVEGWLWLQEEWRMVGVLGVAAWLRFYRLAELMPLIGDQGRDMLAAVEGLREQRLPLLGIPSSVPRFKQGPVYVWLLMFLFGAFGKDPYWAAVTAAAFGLAAVGLTYILAERWWGQKAAFWGALVLAASPLAVAQSRLAFHTNPIPLASIGLLWLLVTKPTNRRSFLWLGFAFALLFQFELAVFPLIVLVGLKVWFKVRNRIQTAVAALGGMIMGMLPQIIYDLTHRFEQLGMFGIWIGYRLASFAGLDREHTVSIQKLSGVIERFGHYSQRFFAPFDPKMVMIAGILMALGLVLYVVEAKRWTGKPVYWLWLWVGVLVAGFMVHGGPSEAYFPALFVPVSLLIGWVVSRLRRGFYWVAGLLLIYMTLGNLHYLWRTDFLMNTPRSVAAGLVEGYGAPLSTQLQVVDWLAEIADGRVVRLQAVGTGSEYSSFLDNYRFLLPLNQVEVDGDQEDGLLVYFLFGEVAGSGWLNSTIYTIDGVKIAIPR